MTELMRRRRALMGAKSAGDVIPAWLQAVDRLEIGFKNAVVTSDLTLDFPGKSVVLNGNAFSIKAVNPDTTIKISCDSVTIQNNLMQGIQNVSTIIFDTNENPTPLTQFCYSPISRILGTPLNFNNLAGTGSYQAFQSTYLREVYFLPNRITNGGGFNSDTLIDNSLVSLANALKEGLSKQQTITLYNTSTKGKLDTIMGTVSEVTEGGSTYHMFEQTSSGSTSLREFITTTKGWVIG